MPKLPPFALERQSSPVQRRLYLLLFFALFTLPLVALHAQLLTLPFFWDEQGQFIPTALDLLRHGWWVARSTLPNVHPPGVELYLVVWYKLFGYSILITRLAMLLLAGAGVLLTFLLAIELSHDTDGAPAFLPPLLLLVSPLFYTQSMMAQLDMPAMVFTLLALLLFLKNVQAVEVGVNQKRNSADLAGSSASVVRGFFSGHLLPSAVVCIALVLVKETGLIVPAAFGAVLLLQKDWKHSLLFVPSALALAIWLAALHAKTGYWLGNPGFAHYNVGYALNPVRIVFSLLRRLYYLFFAEFRWIGTLALLATARQCKNFRTRPWRITFLVALSTLLLVSVLGGAELERYLLPVLPIFYIAVAVAATHLRPAFRTVGAAALLLGLAVSLFWNPPYPFPYENNYAMVDFVRLQQAAAAFTEARFGHLIVATAWPFSAALRNPDYGYVSRPLHVIETNDFHRSSIEDLPPASFGVLITYTRTWMPQNGVIAWPLVKSFLSRFYQWAPPLTLADCEALGLRQEAQWIHHGQEITVYVRPTHHP